MNANQMAEQFELRMNLVDSFAAPSYEDVEISGFLNLAMDLFIEKNLDELLNQKKTGFEETESRGQALSQLIKTGVCSVSSVQQGAFANGVFYDLPDDFKLTIAEVVKIDKNHCKTKTPIQADVVVVSHDEYNRFRRNYYKLPYYNGFEAKVWRMYFSRAVSNYEDENAATRKRHQLITDGSFAVTDYEISYLKEFDPIVVDRANPANMRNCILDDELTHSKIVELAVALADNSNKEQRPNTLLLNMYN
ncbi:MAG TPA: hypothetical protein VIK77_00260 [Tissierellaceae bacterium]